MYSQNMMNRETAVHRTYRSLADVIVAVTKKKKNEFSGEEPTEFLLRRKVRNQNLPPTGFEPWWLGVPLRAQPLGYSPVLTLE
jgi:hypothetical protein